MKTIEEMIKTMEHYKNGGEVEFYNDIDGIWEKASTPKWDWRNTDYRIKKQKKTATIEKWLCKDGNDSYYVRECSHIEGYEKIKLLETYEVEI